MKRHIFSMKRTLLPAALLLFSMSFSTQTLAATAAWKTAYQKVVKQARKEDLKREKTSYIKNYEYRLIYFDGDKIPELVVVNPAYWVSMYRYDSKTKKAVAIMKKWTYGAGGNQGYQYLPKKNSLYNINADHAGLITYHTFMKLSGNKLVNRYKKDLYVYLFDDKNKNNRLDEGDDINEKPYYYYNNKKISKKKFNTYIYGGSAKKYSYMSMNTISYSAILKKLK